jgi:hypothetical protein
LLALHLAHRAANDSGHIFAQRPYPSFNSVETTLDAVETTLNPIEPSVDLLEPLLRSSLERE